MPDENPKTGGPNGPKEEKGVIDTLFETGILGPKSENKCPPHDWREDGEKCSKCGTKDWMT